MFGPGGEFIYDCFIDMMESGFSENQALKLIALMTAASDIFEGMPGTDLGSTAHPSLWGDEDDEDIPTEDEEP